MVRRPAVCAVLLLVLVIPSAALAANVVVATDLPLHGASARASLATNRAVALLLERDGGIAGAHAVAIETYDDSTAATGGWDSFTCEQNATTHVAAAAEVAVLGPYNSGCARVQVPIMNQGGPTPLLMISHSNVYPGLTRAWAPGEPDLYYPTGVRNYGRLLAADDLQGVAAARYAKRALHRTGCLVVSDGTLFGEGLATAFRIEARRVGLRVTARKRWRARTRSYRTFFRTAAAKHPDCVYVAGIADNNGAKLIADKVRVLGSNAKVRLLASDGFLGYPEIRSGKAARGLLITTAGAPAAVLSDRTPAAAAFRNAYRLRWGELPDTALYGAATMQLILEAIKASDGTREGVRLKAFSGLKVPADTSILGEAFGIDPATGATTLPLISMLEVRRGVETYRSYQNLAAG